jgi:hypothetical protein
MLISTVALFTTTKLRNKARCPSMDEWIKKYGTNTVEFNSAIKKNKLMPFSGK